MTDELRTVFEVKAVEGCVALVCLSCLSCEYVATGNEQATQLWTCPLCRKLPVKTQAPVVADVIERLQKSKDISITTRPVFRDPEANGGKVGDVVAWKTTVEFTQVAEKPLDDVMYGLEAETP